MAEKKLSVAEILAAARKADASGGGAVAAKPEPAAEQEGATEAPAAAPKSPAPATKKPGGGGRPSIAEMLAMARGEKSAGGGAAAPPAPKEKPAAKPAAPAAKAAPVKKEPAPAKFEPLDTQSILATARKAYGRMLERLSSAGTGYDDALTQIGESLRRGDLSTVRRTLNGLEGKALQVLRGLREHIDLLPMGSGGKVTLRKPN